MRCGPLLADALPVRERLRRTGITLLDRLGLRRLLLRHRHALDRWYYGFFHAFDRKQPDRREPAHARTSAPFVSFILLSYQHERYVERALESVLAQDYDNMEIVVSDDASSDGSVTRLRAILSGYRGLKPTRLNVNQRNRNWLHLNEVVPLTKGEIIVIGCSDDIMSPHRVSRLVRELEDTGASLVGSNATMIDEHGRILGLYYPAGKPPTLGMRDLVENSHVFPSLGAAIAFRREVWHRFGPLLPGLRAVDLILPFRALLLNGLAYVAEPLLQYRQHATNHSFTRQERQAECQADLDRIEMRRTEERLATLQAMEETLRTYGPYPPWPREQLEEARALIIDATFCALAGYNKLRQKVLCGSLDH